MREIVHVTHKSWFTGLRLSRVVRARYANTAREEQDAGIAAGAAFARMKE